MTIIKNLSQILYKIIFAGLCLLLLIFPLVSFRINSVNEIFPALDIILIYYFTIQNYKINYQLNLLMIFLAGIFFDQLYSLPLGTNSLAFLSAHLILKFFTPSFLLNRYIANFILFCFYCLFILNFRYLIIFNKSLNAPAYSFILFQYLTTIFSYNLIAILLDKVFEYLHAR